MSLHLNSWIPWFVIFHQQIWVQIFLNFHLCSGRKVTVPSRPFFKFRQETIQTLLWSGWQLRTGKTQSKMKQKNWLLCSFSFLRAKSLKILGPRNRSSIGKSGYTHTHTHTHTRQARFCVLWLGQVELDLPEFLSLSELFYQVPGLWKKP